MEATFLVPDVEAQHIVVLVCMVDLTLSWSYTVQATYRPAALT